MFGGKHQPIWFSDKSKPVIEECSNNFGINILTSASPTPCSDKFNSVISCVSSCLSASSNEGFCTTNFDFKLDQPNSLTKESYKGTLLERKHVTNDKRGMLPLVSKVLI